MIRVTIDVVKPEKCRTLQTIEISDDAATYKATGAITKDGTITNPPRAIGAVQLVHKVMKEVVK